MTAHIYLKIRRMNNTKETDWLDTEVFMEKRSIWKLSTGDVYWGGALYKTLEFQIIVKIGHFYLHKRMRILLNPRALKARVQECVSS